MRRLALLAVLLLLPLAAVAQSVEFPVDYCTDAAAMEVYLRTVPASDRPLVASACAEIRCLTETPQADCRAVGSAAYWNSRAGASAPLQLTVPVAPAATGAPLPIVILTAPGAHNGQLQGQMMLQQIMFNTMPRPVILTANGPVEVP